MTDPKHFLIYDDQCRFCTAVKERLERMKLKGVIEYLPAHSPSTQARYPELPLGDCLEAMYFIDDRNIVWKGALAFRELLKYLPFGWAIRWIYFIPGGTWLVHRLYGVVARNRFLFGRIPKTPDRGESPRRPP